LTYILPLIVDLSSFKFFWWAP